ncbi:hypothetical protein JCM10207_002131 [Rhodosporidiobolus poonsookiae]
MLSVLELVSKFFGFWSLGLSLALFIPELVEVLRERPNQLRGDTFGFYVSWLAGDAGQLFGLFYGGGLFTQKILMCCIAAFEVTLLSCMLLFAGIFTYRPCRHARKPAIMSSIAAAHTHEHIDWRPGWASMPRELLALFQLEKKQLTGTRKWLVTYSDWVLTFFTILIMSIVWLVTSYLPRESLEPDHESSMPTDTRTWVAWVVSWAGCVFWIGPRFYNIWDSKKRNEPEGITTASVLMGYASHSCDLIRLWYKRQFKDTTPIPKNIADGPETADGKHFVRHPEDRRRASSHNHPASSSEGEKSSPVASNSDSTDEETRRRQHQILATHMPPIPFDPRFSKKHPVNRERQDNARHLRLYEFEQRRDRLLERLKELKALQRESLKEEKAFADQARHGLPDYERHKLEQPLEEREKEEDKLQARIDSAFAAVPKNEKERQALLKYGINELLAEEDAVEHSNVAGDLHRLRRARHGHADSLKNRFGALDDSDFSSDALQLSDPTASGSDSSARKGLRHYAGRVRQAAKRSSRKEKKSGGA